VHRLALVVVVASCAGDPPPIMAPPDVLARMKPNADTSHNRELTRSSIGGCDDGPSEPVFDGCGPGFREGCGSPRGGGHGGRAGGFMVLGALGLVVRRRRRR
jgi:MYXO-CTERM domain-containing protein